jgi:hypothetical protein
MSIPLPAPPSNTGQKEQEDVDQTKVYLDVLRRLIEENLVQIAGTIPPDSPAGFVLATAPGFAIQSSPLLATQIASGTPAAGKYPDGGTSPATWTALPVVPPQEVPLGRFMAMKHDRVPTTVL